MSDYIDANLLFKMKADIAAKEHERVKKAIFAWVRSEFSKHLLQVATNPRDAGRCVVDMRDIKADVKGNEIFYVSHEILSEFLPELEKHLNDEFSLFNYDINILKSIANVSKTLYIDYNPKVEPNDISLFKLFSNWISKYYDSLFRH